jgi:outer membrane protein assembly factor BamE
MLLGCSSLDSASHRVASVVQPYRPQIVQGNFISREQVEFLRPGITREQVRDILGTPLVSSVFHGDRWDYAFTIQRKGTAPQQRKLSVFFKNDAFERVEAKDLPSEAEFAERISVPEDRKAVPRLQATPQELDKFNKNAPTAAPAETAPAKAPPKSYPPLESSSL